MRSGLIAAGVIVVCLGMGATYVAVLSRASAPGMVAGTAAPDVFPEETGVAAGSVARVLVVPFSGIDGELHSATTLGATEIVRDALAMLPGVDVIGAVSSTTLAASTRLSDAGVGLGATHVLSGRVSVDTVNGSRLQIELSLVSRDGSRAILPRAQGTRDAFELARVASDWVSGALHIAPSVAVRTRIAARGTRSGAAFVQYILARGTPQPDGREQHLRRAIAVDSAFGSAWSLLCIDASAAYDESSQNYAAGLRALAAFARVRASGFDDYLRHVALAAADRDVVLSLDSAIVHLKRAGALAPGNIIVERQTMLTLQRAGRFQEALTDAQRIVALDPRNADAVSAVMRLQLWLHHVDDALKTLVMLQSLSQVSAAAWSDAVLVQMARGSVDDARRLVSTIPDSSTRTRTARDLISSRLLPQALDDSLLARLCTTRSPSARYDQVWLDALTCAEYHSRLEHYSDSQREAGIAAQSLAASIKYDPGSPLKRARYAAALLAMGDSVHAYLQTDTALSLLPLQREPIRGAINGYEYAVINARLGASARATAQVRTLLDAPSPLTLEWLRNDPVFARLRSSSEFKAMMSRSAHPR